MSVDYVFDNLEQTARVLGERWARRLRANLGLIGNGTAPWPGTLDEARHLLNATFVGELPREQLDSLVSILERSARAAWRGS